MRYTTSKKADEKIEEDMRKIKEIIVEKLNPISIILFGGFGRGEGSYEVVKEKGKSKIRPLNDYDLYVVTKKKIPDKKLEEIGRKCSKAIEKGGCEFVEDYKEVYDKNKYFHVDLRWLDYNKLGKMKNINRTYELKYGSSVIYGEDVRKRINDVKIPISEAFRYLINPACHLLLVMDERRLKGKWQKDERFYAQHHITKAELACASSLIISQGKFKASYSETVKEFNKIYGKQFPGLGRRINEALRLKLRYKKIKNLKKRWFQARDDLLFVLRHISKKHLDIEAKDMRELIKKLDKKLPYVYFTPYLPLPYFLAKLAFPAQYFLNILYFKRTHYFNSLLSWKDVGLKIYFSAFLLLYALDNKVLLEDAYLYIKSFSKIRGKTWKDLRIALLYGFDRYYSQKIV